MSHVPATDGPVFDHRCTADERALLDQIAANPTPDIDVDALFELVAAKDAVVDAAVDETNAEDHLTNRRTAALTARHPDVALAELRVVETRGARRAAIAALREAQR